MTFRTILVPVDFSSYALAAAEHAIDLAKLSSGKIVLLHSSWIDLPTSMTLSVTRPDLWSQELLDEVDRIACERLEEIAKRAAQAGVACEMRQSRREPVGAILEAAAQLPADVIVMGTRGHTGLKHVLLGSVAERTVRFAPCPVLTVKSPRS